MNGQSPTVQSLSSCLGQPVAVIEGSHVDALVPQLLPLLFVRLSSLQGLPHLLINLPLQWVCVTATLAILITVGFRNNGHQKLNTM